MQNPLVSVIIPCYNQGIYMEDALSSIYRQTYKNIEVIVVNDGSNDDITASILGSVSHPMVQIFTTINQGLSEARNYGIKRSSGKYILPLDADDMINERYIEQAVNILEERKSIGIVYGKAIFFGEQSGDWELEEFDLEKMKFSNLIYASAIFSRENYDKTSGYDRGMSYGWEDWEFWLSMLELGVEVYFIDNLCFHYRVTKKSMIRSMKDHQKSYSFQRVYCNHPNLYNNYFKDPISLYYDYKYYKKEHDKLLDSKVIRLVNYFNKKFFGKR